MSWKLIGMPLLQKKKNNSFSSGLSTLKKTPRILGMMLLLITDMDTF